jgi:hypothetical protein
LFYFFGYKKTNEASGYGENFFWVKNLKSFMISSRDFLGIMQSKKCEKNNEILKENLYCLIFLVQIFILKKMVIPSL